jgi:hypothetical protein
MEWTETSETSEKGWKRRSTYGKRTETSEQAWKEDGDEEGGAELNMVHDTVWLNIFQQL